MPTIAIYRGSFDPPHHGHEEIVSYCLEKKACDKVYIVANESNSRKPLRLDYVKRKAMLELVFKNNSQVEIVDENTFELISKLRQQSKENYIFGVMGSDGAVLIKNGKLTPEKYDVDEWLVVTRETDKNIEMPQFIDGRKTTYLPEKDFNQQSYSSTAIRKYFAEHDNFFQRNESVAATSLPLNHKLLEFIKIQNFYRVNKVTLFKPVDVNEKKSEIRLETRQLNAFL